MTGGACGVRNVGCDRRGAWDMMGGHVGHDRQARGTQWQGVVRGMSAGTAMDTPGSAQVVVIGLWLRWWGRWEGLADGGVHKGEARGSGGWVSGQVATGREGAACEGGGGTGAMDGCGGTQDRAEVHMGGPGHMGQPGTC